METQLKFYNRSNDCNNSTVVIFQKPINPNWNMETIAWQVIKNCGNRLYHPFVYEYDMAVSASDSYGNYSLNLPASPGDDFEMKKDHSGDDLKPMLESANDPSNIVVKNHLVKGSIAAYCYRSGKLLCKKNNIVPNSEAIFHFKPFIYIGVVSDVEEGKTMDAAIVKEINTEISLLNVKSADIVMYGGGIGTESVPYRFELENVVSM